MDIWGIVNSNFFIGLVTLFVGLFAFIIYSKQKRDYKRDAASVVLLEITNAERLLKRAKELIRETPPKLLSDTLTMQTESWSKYKYLFVNDFNRDEWDGITDFYNKCQLYDQAVLYNNSFFQKNEGEIRVNLQRTLSDFVKIYVEKLKKPDDNLSPDLPSQVRLKMENYYKNYMEKGQKTGAFYYPGKPIDDARLYLDLLNVDISQTNIGAKFRRLSEGSSFRWKVFGKLVNYKD